ncbi:MAG: hypothetical protein ETSY1_26055 [Candidatus Entotheonella factor]|uniref:Protein-glutamine gamma-glutamyltransferase-like C-terminal domain-containing protein n=1 Tax=Entotheonella factor TaxID=1429438 RepID=W4LFT5_ENTF1|nr:DUF4129 domain-containing protein [Candidatus Entotheonella palauensis]ETW96585.1 MAG: hypothetical protein ETSY1_26055 [Candidatus Entotheonella factor]
MITPSRPYRITAGFLLSAAGLSLGLYLSGLAASLRLGDASARGFLLIPKLPTPLYIIMAIVVLACISITFLNSFLRRRKPPDDMHQRRPEDIKAPWYVRLITLISILSVPLFLFWLLRQGSPLREVLMQWRRELAALQANPLPPILQVDSPIAGYALFIVVLVIYGGIAALGIWVLFDGRLAVPDTLEGETEDVRRVRRAVTAGLRALHDHDDPRYAIIACYAQLEHLLEDYGMPAHATLTPQEYMGAALRGIDVPEDTFASLVALFEQARYSLHPLHDTDKQAAAAYLETIKAHLERESAIANRI